MKAGRELDALIAERVFRWRRSDETGELCWHTPDMIFECGIPNLVNKLLPHYSTSIEAAWEVAIAARLFSEKCWYLWNDGTHWCVGETNGVNDCCPHVKGDTATHVICLAALKALGVEI